MTNASFPHHDFLHEVDVSLRWPFLFTGVILSTRLGGSTSRYPAKPARFSVSWGPGSHSERELM